MAMYVDRFKKILYKDSDNFNFASDDVSSLCSVPNKGDS